MTDRYSFIDYIGNGTNTEFPIDFQYISPDHIFVTVDDSEAQYDWASPGVVSISPAPPASSVVHIYRKTPTDPLVIFGTGSPIRGRDLNTGLNQPVFIAQEAQDRVNGNMGRPNGVGYFDAQELNIRHVGDPVDHTDAVNLRTVEDMISLSGLVGPQGPQGPAGTPAVYSNATPAASGTAAPGVANEASRADHVHPVPTKAAIGLGNVDNTSDVDKPVSTAVQIALDAALAQDIDPSRVSYGQTFVFGRSVGAGQGLPDGYAPNNGSNFLAGINAGKSATASRDLIAIGTGSASGGTKHFDCTFLGIDAGKYNEAKTHLYDQNQRQGSRNIAIGGNALRFNRNGFGITAIGRNAGQSVELPDENTSSYITALGAGALAGAAPIGLSGEIENWAPLSTSGAKATAIGVGALTAYSGANATAIGSRALEGLKKGNYNTAVGDMALFALESGSWNNGGTKTDVNISGTYTQSGTTLTLSIPAHGLSVGDIALFRLLDGGSQTFQNDIIPAYVATVPNANTFTITHPLSLTSSGTAMLYSLVTGTASITASENTAMGAEAGRNAASSAASSLFGRYAGYSATALDRSTLVGMMTGYSSSSLTTCSLFGYSAGRFDLAGAAVTGAMVNRTALGYAAPTSGDNQVQLGNSSTTPYAYAALQVRSDRRDKANIRPTSLGLDFLMRIEPVEYQWDLRDDYIAEMPPPPPPPPDDAPAEVRCEWEEALKTHNTMRRGWFADPVKDGSKTRKRYHQGVIAQQVKEAADQLGVDFSGYQDHSLTGGNDVKTIAYDAFVPVLIRAVQELSALVDDLSSKVNSMKEK